MVWVKSEYADELAVVSAWLAALLPWAISYTPSHVDFPGTVVYVRFPFLEIRYVFDFALADALVAHSPAGGRTLVGGSTTGAYDLWLVAAIPLYLAVCLAFALFVASGSGGPTTAHLEERLPVSPAVAFWGSFAVPSVLLAAATLYRIDLGTQGEDPAVYWLVGAALAGLLGWLWVTRHLGREHLATWLPGGPVRTMGALLLTTGVGFAAASVAFFLWSPFDEWPIPVGVPIVLVLGAILLRVDLVGAESDGDAATDDADATA